jgi:hypothetical protein
MRVQTRFIRPLRRPRGFQPSDGTLEGFLEGIDDALRTAPSRLCPEGIRVLVPADQGVFVDFTASTASQAVVPKNVFGPDALLLCAQLGTGTLTLVPEDNTVTLITPPGRTLVSAGTGSVIMLRRVRTGANVWLVSGDLETA